MGRRSCRCLRQCHDCRHSKTSAVIALGNTLEGVVGGYLIARWSGGTDTFFTPAQVAKFAAVCVGPATIISATIGVTTLCAAGLAHGRIFPGYGLRGGWGTLPARWW
jgi:integral membrane sensor domain MASE1